MKMSYRLSNVVDGHLAPAAGMKSPRQVIRNRDNKVVAYVDTKSGPPQLSSELTKSDVKALGTLRRPAD
jgi:hypothetical protein